MRIIKPLFLTPLPAVFDDGRRLHCVVTVVFHAKFDGELCEERELWPFAAEEVEGVVLDEAMPKPRAEWLVHGSCYANGPDVRQSFVKARVGDQEKILAIFGKRVFKMGVPTTPEPFDVVPIRFTHAFGGAGFAENPAGKGFGGGELPQVEVRTQLVKSPDDRPPIGALGRVDVQLPQRMKKAGTYDMKWFKTRYPGMADDFDGSYFQLAMPDQWRKEFFRGDEPFSAVNMHPEKSQLDGKLPGVTARCFVKRTGEQYVDVPMRIDTVHLFPGRERVAVVCRGTTPTKSDLLADIEEIGCGLEWIGRPKPQRHYEEVFTLRKTKKGGGGALASLDDTALLPEAAPKAKERIVPPGEGLQFRQLDRKMQHAYEQAQQALIDNGIDPKCLPPRPKIEMSVDPDDIPPMQDEPPTMDSVKAEIAKKRGETIAQMRAEIEKASKDLPPEQAAKAKDPFEATVAKFEAGHVGPPEFSRAQMRAQLEDQVTLLKNVGAKSAHIQALLDDQDHDQRLRNLEEVANDSYRKGVQHQGAAPSLGKEKSETLRAMVRIRIDAGEPFEGVDLTGADLSGLDLRGANFSKGWLESADLTGADLEGADFDHAVLARAKLPTADLRRCKLRGANLSEADLTGADLSGLDLEGCFFVRTNLTDTKMVDTNINEVDFEDAKLIRTDLSGCKLKNGVLMNLRFEGVSLQRASWEKALVYQCELRDVDARRANLNMVLLVDTRIEGARFDDAILPKLQAAKIDKIPSFIACSFIGTSLELGLFRGALFERCDFRHSNFNKADFSGATADGTRFEDARGVGARFVSASIKRCRFDRADLMTSFFGGAAMDGAVFDDANLFRTDFARTVGDNVKMTGANVKRVRTVPKREENP